MKTYEVTYVTDKNQSDDSSNFFQEEPDARNDKSFE